MKYYRRTHKQNPMSDWGHAMFVCESDLNKISSYGQNLHTVNSNSGNFVHIDSLTKEMSALYAIMLESGKTCASDIDSFIACFNPSDIVNSAEAWDDAEHMMMFWDHIGEPANIDGVLLDNGAIIFNTDIISNA